MSGITVTQTSTGVRFEVRVQPRASRNEVAGAYGTAMKIRLSAPPVDGAANEALIAYFAELMGIPRRSIRIVAGLSSRKKIVEIDDIRADRIHEIAAGRTQTP